MEYKIINNLKVFFRKGTSDESVIQDTIIDHIFERGFPEYKPKKNHLVIDIGAHIGTYSLVFAQHLTEGVIHAFEPCLDTFNYLEQNIIANNLNNVFSHKVALSDNIGTTKLYYDIEQGNWGHSIVKDFSSEGEIVKTDTLSNFFITNNIKKCDFIKFNCEGAEFNIILSTPIPILKKIDKMLVLYHLDLADGVSIELLISHLKNAGFYTEIRQARSDEKRGWLIAIRGSIFTKVKLSYLRHYYRFRVKLGAMLRPVFNKFK